MTLPVETLCDLLADRRRRAILAILADEPDETTIDRLLDRLVADLTHVESDVCRARLAADLHHVQLPRLNETTVVDYDSRSGAIRYDGDPELERWVAAARETAARAC